MIVLRATKSLFTSCYKTRLHYAYITLHCITDTRPSLEAPKTKILRNWVQLLGKQTYLHSTLGNPISSGGKNGASVGFSRDGYRAADTRIITPFLHLPSIWYNLNNAPISASARWLYCSREFYTKIFHRRGNFGVYLLTWSGLGAGRPSPPSLSEQPDEAAHSPINRWE